MKVVFITPVGLCRTILAAAVALVLSSAAYATDPEPTPGQAAAARVAVAVSVTKSADDSANNARDVAGDDVTPLNQSNAEADVELTRSIRKLLVDDEILGTNAQNVKVTTAGGMVTLHGAVPNADDQTRVEAIANSVAGMGRVVNQLKVIRR